MPLQDDERIRICDRQRAQQDRVHETVESGVGTNAKRQRENRQHAENFVTQHHPPGVTQVLYQLFQKSPDPDGTDVLLQQSHVPQFAMCGKSGFIRPKSVVLVLLSFFLKMELEFFTEFSFLTPTLDQPGQFTEERNHDAS